MVSDVPNMAFTLGYTNASWTLKADLTATFVCKLLEHMDAKGYAQCCARPAMDPSMKPEDSPLNLTSGYVQVRRLGLPCPCVSCRVWYVVSAGALCSCAR
jgi:cation diffusion facilitator CzcD-associated flavoprotein CzcO